jgi:endonuclease YncB( thermonuclease family)
VARCEVGGTDLGAWLVEQGWALAYRRYGSAYVAQEDRARAGRRGLWAGTFVPPWAWRRGNEDKVSAGSYAGA